MSEIQSTDERLRTWLNGNQPSRERLCAHLLPLLGDYSNVTSRRPEGGRDGGRDIEALYEGTMKTWCAVGFLNGANDSPDHKKRIRKKFKDDLNAALKNNSNLKGFVFFTNIDLTPREEDNLTSHVAKKGIEHVKIFFRERLRLVLDSPAGWGYRVYYLGIPMKPEEQLTFFENYENKREKDLAEINARQKEISSQVQRLEFLNDTLRPVRDVATYISFKQPITANDLGHFRLAIELSQLDSSFLPASPYLSVGGRDHYLVLSNGVQDEKLLGIETLAWTTSPENNTKPNNILYDLRQGCARNTRTLCFHAPLLNCNPFRLLGDFDRAHYDIYISETLLKHIETIMFIVNDYVLIGIHRSKMVLAEDVGLRINNDNYDMPLALSEEEKAIRCRQIYLRCEDTDNTDLIPPDRHRSRMINFYERTPVRCVFRDEIVDV